MGIPLVTKAEYKAYAGLTSTNQDASIDLLIPKVSDLVKTICRRTFVDYVNDAKVEVFEGGASFYVPAEYPVLAISTLEYSNDYGNTYTELTEFTDYALSKKDDTLKCIGGDFKEAINAYRLTYTAGFEVLPTELKLAVLDLITYYMHNDMAIHSNKAPGTNTVQIEYVTSTNLPSHIKRILDLYTSSFA